ncbi:MAG: T9SS type A sorting domain-containing protein, partial [Saprospiraceae bacterium]
FIENLAAGTYTVSVTDVNGCSAIDTVLIIDRGLMVESSMFSYNTCGYASGMATADPLDGTPPYQFQWSTGETTQTIDSLAAGTYTATVTDAVGCSGTEVAYVDSNFPLSILAQIPTPFCLNAIAPFVYDSPPIYPQILWTLSDTLDQIISGQGTDSIKVQWASVGTKTVKYQYGANGIYCGSITFSLKVVVCADANEPTLAGAVVSPNPFSDFLQIEFSAGLPNKAEAVLTDVSGKIVLRKTLIDLAEILPTANVPAGIYFLKIRSGNGERVWKVVKL